MEAPLSVALFFFNRPELFARVFAEVRRARPTRLFLVADGPRLRPMEDELCRRTRAVAEAVDWPCEVMRDYSEANLGCRRRLQTGLNWVFSRVEEAVVLEDDCLPGPDFFPYCAELLRRYRDDASIMAISGAKVWPDVPGKAASYRLCRYPQVWGWASWRRAWSLYDGDMADWPARWKTGWLRSLLCDPAAVAYWEEKFWETYLGRVDTWDYQWTYTLWCRGGKSLAPAKNMVTNIGAGAEATHTVQDSPFINLPAEPGIFPLDPGAHDDGGILDAHIERCLYSGLRPVSWRRRVRRVLEWPYRRALAVRREEA